MQSKEKPILIPAILSSELRDYLVLSKKFSKFSNQVHLDIMDGKFVKSQSPNLSDILTILNSLPIFKSIHLMTEDIEKNLQIISKFDQINTVYVHIENFEEKFFEYNFNFDLALVMNPDTKVDDYVKLIQKSNIIQIMTVNPGFQGSEFIKKRLELIPYLRNNLSYEGEIHIDGGVNKNTIEEILKFDPDVLNIGSAISKFKDPKKAYEDLEKLINNLLN